MSLSKLISKVWRPRWPSRTFSCLWWPSHPNWCSRSPGWRPRLPSRPLRSLSMLKKAPNQADNFANFSVMLLYENHLFGSSAGSDLQAITEHYCTILHHWNKMKQFFFFNRINSLKKGLVWRHWNYFILFNEVLEWLADIHFLSACWQSLSGY